MESRNMDPDNFLMETILRLLLAPFSPLEGLKGHLFCVTNLSPVHVQATGRGGSWGMRMDVSPMQWPCQVCRAWEPLLSWCLHHPCPSRVPLPPESLTPSPGGVQGPSPMASFWGALTPNAAAAGHKDLALSFSSASWRGCTLGGWAVLPWKPQMGIWFQKWTAPGSEHDLVQTRTWAPGLTLFSHPFFSLGITSERLGVCPCLWGSGCLNRYQPLKKKR